MHVEVILEKNTVADTGPWFVRIRNSDIEMSEQLVSEDWLVGSVQLHGLDG
jgi:hypothetical protein